MSRMSAKIGDFGCSVRLEDLRSHCRRSPPGRHCTHRARTPQKESLLHPRPTSIHDCHPLAKVSTWEKHWGGGSRAPAVSILPPAALQAPVFLTRSPGRRWRRHRPALLRQALAPEGPSAELLLGTSRFERSSEDSRLDPN